MIVIALILVLVIIGVLLLWLLGTYNGLVRLRANRENAFADIDVHLKQRNDLIPQLVQVVKGYSFHEKDVLDRVISARAGISSAHTIDEKVQADNALTSALQGLRLTVEAYPDLKANTNFLQLQEEISDIENKLAATRRYFNAATRELNVGVESFPAVLIARSFGFEKAAMYDLGSEKRAEMDTPPKINFN